MSQAYMQAKKMCLAWGISPLRSPILFQLSNNVLYNEPNLLWSFSLVQGVINTW